jgi:methylamine dehydrogenase accessory protein MauD
MSLSIAIVVLWVVVLCLGITVFALARQIGILYERIAPMGALMLDDGPKVGEQSPSFDLATLDGGRIKIGATSTHGELVFFLSPTCPVCKKLIPILRSMREKEKHWLTVILASDGDELRQKKFYETTKLQDFPYVLSNDLGMAFKVAKLPYAVLIDEAGIVRSKGLINNREQLESLLTAKELAVESIQQYLHTS